MKCMQKNDQSPDNLLSTSNQESEEIQEKSLSI